MLNNEYFILSLVFVQPYPRARRDNELGAEPAGSCTNIVVADPKFVSTADNDYRLLTGSPAIDGGDASLISTVYVPDQSTDLYANVRLKGAEVDIGACEWQPPSGTLFLLR